MGHVACTHCEAIGDKSGDLPSVKTFNSDEPINFALSQGILQQTASFSTCEKSSPSSRGKIDEAKAQSKHPNNAPKEQSVATAISAEKVTRGAIAPSASNESASEMDKPYVKAAGSDASGPTTVEMTKVADVSSGASLKIQEMDAKLFACKPPRKGEAKSSGHSPKQQNVASPSPSSPNAKTADADFSSLRKPLPLLRYICEEVHPTPEELAIMWPQTERENVTAFRHRVLA